MHLNLGKVLDGRYKIMHLIKIGGMSNIYKAQDTRLEKICAIKELICHHEEPEEVEYAIKRFKEEAKLLAELSHANLPRVTDYFTFGVYYYLVMDFIEGVDLETILRRNEGKGLNETDVINWAIQICDVLDYLHNQKPNPIIYRDIKPANIMLREGSDKIVLIDFGIAREINPKGNVTAIGTMEYAPMEQYQGKAEPRSDIYGLGATMHHLLTARPPIPFKFPKVRNLREDLSPEIEAIVEKALAPKAAGRFQTAKNMQAQLLALYATGKVCPGTGEKSNHKDERTSEELIEKLKKGDKKAAIILGEKRVTEAVGLLVKALESDDYELRLEAALALGKIGDPSAIPHLVELMKKERTTGNLKIEEALRQLKQSAEKKEPTFWNKLISSMKDFFTK